MRLITTMNLCPCVVRCVGRPITGVVLSLVLK
jgi:hypothetical protein